MSEQSTSVTEQMREEYQEALRQAREKERGRDDRPEERGDGMPVGSPPPEVL